MSQGFGLLDSQWYLQAREKQLEEARRLAALQKKRELKAAGGLEIHV